MDEMYRVDWLDGSASYLDLEAYDYLHGLLKTYAANERDVFVEFQTLHGAVITTWLSRVHNLSYTTPTTRKAEYEYNHAVGEEAKDFKPKGWE